LHGAAPLELVLTDYDILINKQSPASVRYGRKYHPAAVWAARAIGVTPEHTPAPPAMFCSLVCWYDFCTLFDDDDPDGLPSDEAMGTLIDQWLKASNCKDCVLLCLISRFLIMGWNLETQLEETIWSRMAGRACWIAGDKIAIPAAMD